jgi:hypothetical protein
MSTSRYGIALSSANHLVLLDCRYDLPDSKKFQGLPAIIHALPGTMPDGNSPRRDHSADQDPAELHRKKI